MSSAGARRPLGGVAVPADTYGADGLILERYQGYAQEIIRLASLGIAVIGFFVKDLAWSSPPWTKGLLIIAVCAFLVAIGCALSHRYASTDGFGSHIEAQRARRLDPPDECRVGEAERHRTKLYKRSRSLLIASSVTLWAGAFCIVIWTVVALLQ